MIDLGQLFQLQNLFTLWACRLSIGGESDRYKKCFFTAVPWDRLSESGNSSTSRQEHDYCNLFSWPSIGLEVDCSTLEVAWLSDRRTCFVQP